MTTFQFYLAVIIFCLTYVGIMSEKFPRTICALVGGGAMIYAGYVTQSEAFGKYIDWNTLGLLAGMMILISVVKKSGFFRVLALWAMKRSKGSPRELLVLLSCVTAVGASLIDSVTAALLIAPMTISLCRMLNISPVPVLVSEILMCNVGGTALMIGNPPNVIKHTEMILSLACMINKESPRARQGRITGAFSVRFCFLRRSVDLVPNKKLNTQMQEQA